MSISNSKSSQLESQEYTREACPHMHHNFKPLQFHTWCLTHKLAGDILTKVSSISFNRSNLPLCSVPQQTHPQKPNTFMPPKTLQKKFHRHPSYPNGRYGFQRIDTPELRTRHHCMLVTNAGASCATTLSMDREWPVSYLCSAHQQSKRAKLYAKCVCN